MTKEEARLTLQENFGYLSEEHPRIIEALKVALNVLGEPSLPSDLDKVAEKQGEMVDNYGDPYGAVVDAFKAGAKWMAGQGVILNLSIDELSCGAYNACVEQGLTSEDDVIVQIRKKEENHD